MGNQNKSSSRVVDELTEAEEKELTERARMFSEMPEGIKLHVAKEAGNGVSSKRFLQILRDAGIPRVPRSRR